MARVWLTFLISILVLPAAAANQASTLSGLSDKDRAKFEDIVKAIDEWDGSVWAYNDIKEDIKKLSFAHPGSIPIEIEVTRLEWARISDRQGVRTGSMSFLPRFLGYAQKEPDYAKVHLLAARAYIFAQDYEGAIPSLNKATQLDPSNPWVDLTWSLLNERKFNRALAVEWARKALEKSTGSRSVTASAITAITKNRGVEDLEAASALAKGLASLEPNPEVRIEIAGRLIDSYYFQPGLLETAGAILDQANVGSEPTPTSLLQWARISLQTGYVSSRGPKDTYDENYLQSAKKILRYVERVSDLDLQVQPFLLEIAIKEGKIDETSGIIQRASDLGATKTWIAWARAQVLFSRMKYAEVASIYEENLLSPRDRAYVESTTSRSLDRTGQQYIYYIEWDPASPHPYGNYAAFLLYTMKDTVAAIHYAREAMKIGPYPAVQTTLATAFLYQSGIRLRDGYLDDALKSYEEAKAVGFDEKMILQQCYALCSEVSGAMNAFR